MKKIVSSLEPKVGIPNIVAKPFDILRYTPSLLKYRSDNRGAVFRYKEKPVLFDFWFEASAIMSLGFFSIPCFYTTAVFTLHNFRDFTRVSFLL